MLPTTRSSVTRAGDFPNLVKAILGGATIGMGTIDQSLAELVQDDIVAADVATEHAVDPNEVRYLLSGDTR